VLGERCRPTDENRAEVAHVPQCAAPVEVVGEVGGIGVTQSGASLVGVEFEVPRACFEESEPGMEWPPIFPSALGVERSALGDRSGPAR